MSGWFEMFQALIEPSVAAYTLTANILLNLDEFVNRLNRYESEHTNADRLNRRIFLVVPALERWLFTFSLKVEPVGWRGPRRSCGLAASRPKANALSICFRAVPHRNGFI